MDLLLEDRAGAGRQLATALTKYRNCNDVLVLAVSPGGVPVAAEMAEALQVRLDVLAVRKLALPGSTRPLGAVAFGGSRVLDWALVSTMDVSDESLDALTEREQDEVDRLMRLYRGERLPPELNRQRVILVDDGADTGATMRAAISAASALRPATLVLALPVARFEVLGRLQSSFDEAVCIGTPYPFESVGRWYWYYPEVADDAVRELLALRWALEDARAEAATSFGTRAVAERSPVRATERPKRAARTGICV